MTPRHRRLPTIGQAVDHALQRAFVTWLLVVPMLLVIHHAGSNTDLPNCATASPRASTYCLVTPTP